MLLFSTVLNVTDLLTPERFLNLVADWNEKGSPANRVQGVQWENDLGTRFGSETLWLEVLDFSEKHVLAVRHEKITDDGVVWDSDFIFDYSGRKISVQLDRTYSEEALVMNADFSTPHFITRLIEQGYLAADKDFPILREPIYITEEDTDLMKKIMNGGEVYHLPIVFVSKTADNQNPLSVSWLASRLKGAAHVLVEESVEQCEMLRSSCGISDEPFGAVRIFFPPGSVKTKKYTYRSATVETNQRLKNVIQSVIQYGIAQKTERLLTWNGVNNELLNHRLEHQISVQKTTEEAKRQAEEEVEAVYEAFDEDLKELQDKVAELTRTNEALRLENQGLRAKYAAVDEIPILYMGEEEDYYQGEIRDMILSILHEALSVADKATRKTDALKDILENNQYYRLGEERKQRVKQLFKGYKNITSAMRQELQSMGFELTEGGKHYRITYHGDSRYQVTAPKTPSDYRSGTNCAAAINKTML